MSEDAVQFPDSGTLIADTGTGAFVARQQGGTEVCRTGELCVGQQACARGDGCVASAAHNPEAFRKSSAASTTAKPVVDLGFIERLAPFIHAGSNKSDPLSKRVSKWQGLVIEVCAPEDSPSWGVF